MLLYLSALVAVFLLAVALEQPGKFTTTYRGRSLAVLRHAAALLVASAIIGLRRLCMVPALSVLPNWVPVDASHNPPQGTLRSLLLDPDPEVRMLREQLTGALAEAAEHQKQAELLETRLTHEQLRARRAHGEASSVLRRQSLSSLSSPRLTSLRDAVLIIHFFWRLSRTLCEKLTRFGANISRLEGTLDRTRDTCNNLRLDNNLLKVSSDDLRSQLAEADRARAHLSHRLFGIHIRYAKSLEARHQAARLWVAYRVDTDGARIRSFRSFFAIISMLWRYVSYLRRALDKEHSLLSAARLAQDALQARYTTLEDTARDLGKEILVLKDRDRELENACQRKASALEEEQLCNDRLRESQVAAAREHRQTRNELIKMRTQFDALLGEHTRLTAERNSTIEEQDRLEARHAELAATHTGLRERFTHLDTAYNVLHDVVKHKETEYTSLSKRQAALETLIEDTEARAATDQAVLEARSSANLASRAEAEARCTSLERESTTLAEASGHLLSAFAAHVAGLDAHIRAEAAQKEAVFLPMYRLMMSVGSQINRVTPVPAPVSVHAQPFPLQLLSPPPSAGLHSPRLPSPPSSADVHPPRAFASTGSEPALSEFFATSIRIPPSAEKGTPMVLRAKPAIGRLMLAGHQPAA